MSIDSRQIAAIVGGNLKWYPFSWHHSELPTAFTNAPYEHTSLKTVNFNDTINFVQITRIVFVSKLFDAGVSNVGIAPFNSNHFLSVNGLGNFMANEQFNVSGTNKQNGVFLYFGEGVTDFTNVILKPVTRQFTINGAWNAPTQYGIDSLDAWQAYDYVNPFCTWEIRIEGFYSTGN